MCQVKGKGYVLDGFPNNMLEIGVKCSSQFMATEVEQFSKKSMCCGKGKILLNNCKKVSYFL